MERNILKDVQFLTIDAVAAATPYLCRASAAEDALKSSIARMGIVSPLWVAQDSPAESAQIISGHRRIQAARDLGLPGVPVLKVEKGLPPKMLFQLALLSNWNQNLADLDRACAVQKALHGFQYSLDETVNDVLPLLGIPAQRSFVEEALKVMSLEKKILEAIASEALPFRGASVLARLGPEEQNVFAARVIPAVKLTSSQLQQIGDWLPVLLKSGGVPLDTFLENESIRSLLDDPAQDKRQKGEAFFRILWELKHPLLAEHGRHFREAAKQIKKQLPEAEVEAPAYFEAPGFVLRTRIKDPETLDRVLEKLGGIRPDLRGLFRIML